MTQILNFRLELAADDGVSVKQVQAHLQTVLRQARPPVLQVSAGVHESWPGLGGEDGQLHVHMATSTVKIGQATVERKERKPTAPPFKLTS